MSADKFWDQWASSQPERKPAEGEGAQAGGDASADSPDDALSAWLKSLPVQEPVAHTPPESPAQSAATPAAPWPQAGAVDPFAGIQAPPASAGDWDLALDLPPSTGVAPVPTPEASAPPPPFGVPDAPGGGETTASPFGPPPPPPPPPRETLSAPPLRLEIRIGRRVQELSVRGEALLGRPDATRGIHPEIDLRQDDAVSRRHAKIWIKNGGYVLTDLNSTNGTRHNRRWVQPEEEVVLRDGDEIEVGEMTIIRVLEAPGGNAEA